MFAEFSAHLYTQIAENEYQTHAGEEASAHWVAQKLEMSTLVRLHVIDATQISAEALINYDKTTRAHMGDSHQITNLYLLTGDEPPIIDGAEEYFGQPVYSIFWHLNLSTGEISTQNGQPKKLFNLREMISTALRQTHTATAAPHTFREISDRAAARAKPKHRHPYCAYALIVINAAVLGFMYLQGYYEGNTEVVRRLGGLVSGYVIFNNEWYRLFTAMFLHFGVAHFAANAMGILIFGTRVERYLGRRIFLAIYLFSGLLGSVFSLANLHFLAPHGTLIVSAGASGAVYGIVGAMFAYTRVSKRSIESINWYIMFLFIGIGMAAGFATVGIDNFAHLGGLLGGALIGWIFAVKKGAA